MQVGEELGLTFPVCGGASGVGESMFFEYQPDPLVGGFLFIAVTGNLWEETGILWPNESGFSE